MFLPSIVYVCKYVFAYRRHDNDQKLLSLELLHRAHFDVGQAHLTQQHTNLLTLGRKARRL